jgi:hypothetical protein
LCVVNGLQYQFLCGPSGLKPTCTEGAAIADRDEESVVAITAATSIFKHGDTFENMATRVGGRRSVNETVSLLSNGRLVNVLVFFTHPF